MFCDLVFKCVRYNNIFPTYLFTNLSIKWFVCQNQLIKFFSGIILWKMRSEQTNGHFITIWFIFLLSNDNLMRAYLYITEEVSSCFLCGCWLYTSIAAHSAILLSLSYLIREVSSLLRIFFVVLLKLDINWEVHYLLISYKTWCF